MMSIPHAVQGNVVDPHVEVGPVNAHQENHASKRRMATRPRQNKADANGDFHHAGDEDPNGWVAQDRWNNRFKPGRVGEVLHPNVDVHASKHDSGDGDEPASHALSLRHHQVKFCVIAN